MIPQRKRRWGRGSRQGGWWFPPGWGGSRQGGGGPIVKLSSQLASEASQVDNSSRSDPARTPLGPGRTPADPARTPLGPRPNRHMMAVTPVVHDRTMTVRQELHQLVDDLCGDDSKRALAAYRRISIDELPWLERRAVLAARRRGASWAAIGRLLGRSRQSVQQRFDRVFDVGELSRPPVALPPGRAERKRLDSVRSDLARDRRVDAAGDDGSLVAW